jgi:Negative regulator of sigma F
MTCNELDDLISSRSSLSGLPPVAAVHLAGCERCRSLVRVLQEDSARQAPSRRGLGQIKAAILQDLKPVKSIPPAFAFLAAFGTIFLAVTVVGSFQLRAFGWGALNIPQRVVVFASLAAGMGLLASSMVRQMFPGSKHLVSPRWLPVGVLALLTLEAAAVFQPKVEFAFFSNGSSCLRAGLSYAIPGALLLWLVLRHGAILSPKLTAATAGAFAGLIGLTVLEVHCPILNRYHILVWHIGVVLLSMLGGLSLGAAWERIGT